MKETLINGIFDALNGRKVRYAVLRGYLPLSELYAGADIDLYIDREDMGTARKIFAEHGFRTPRLNACAYPHVQFFRLTADGMIKFDIVYDLCFGQDLCVYRDLRAAADTIVPLDRIRVFGGNAALEILLLHICFDKGGIDEHNFVRLNNLVREYRLASSGNPAVRAVLDEVNAGTLTIDGFNRRIREISDGIRPLVRENRGAALHNLKTRLTLRLRYFLHKYKNKGVAILGVDGSGKSTAIARLHDALKDRSVVQYMGFREMETKYGKEWYENPSGAFRRLKLFAGIYFEMRIRYGKNTRKPHGLVIYDRYPWEAYENAAGKAKAVYYVLFRVLFPSPAAVYYIHCDAETSFARKDDITDRESFRVKKRNADRKYLNRKGVVSFDSDQQPVDEIVQGICQDIMETGLYDYLF